MYIVEPKKYKTARFKSRFWIVSNCFTTFFDEGVSHSVPVFVRAQGGRIRSAPSGPSADLAVQAHTRVHSAAGHPELGAYLS
jgi:hypothetical protein